MEKKTKERIFTRDEVKQHNTRDDCYIIINGYVYDVTSYLDFHPGGSSLILKDAGGDATHNFLGMFHSNNARKILQNYLIGRLKDAPQTLSVHGDSMKTGFSNSMRPPKFSFYSSSSMTKNFSRPKKAISNVIFTSFKILQINKVTHNTLVFRIQCPLLNEKFNIPMGKHVKLSFTDEKGDQIIRSYTPIRDKKGYLELLVKIYKDGKFSQHLASLKPGDTILMKGPEGKFEYQQGKFKKFVMICMGTGIAPMYQIFYRLLRKKENVNITLLFANRTEEDILLKKQIDKFANEFDNFTVHYILSRPKDENYQLKGRINEEMIKKFVGEGNDQTQCLICGSESFSEKMNEYLCNIGHKNVFIF